MKYLVESYKFKHLENNALLRRIQKRISRVVFEIFKIAIFKRTPSIKFPIFTLHSVPFGA